MGKVSCSITPTTAGYVRFDASGLEPNHPYQLKVEGTPERVTNVFSDAEGTINRSLKVGNDPTVSIWELNGRRALCSAS